MYTESDDQAFLTGVTGVTAAPRDCPDCSGLQSQISALREQLEKASEQVEQYQFLNSNLKQVLIDIFLQADQKTQKKTA